MGLCRLFGALPSQVLAEDASVLRLLDVYTRGHREEDEEDEGGEDG
ncbi:MAG TPA: hypothetical protein VIL16_12565 [Trebonia sp.]